MNIASIVQDLSGQHSSKIAIVENGFQISYKELFSRIEKLSRNFQKIGIKENQRVALLISNSTEFICCFFALLKCNVIVCPLNTGLTQFELVTIFNNLNPHAIITVPGVLQKVFPAFYELRGFKTFKFQGDIKLEGLRLDGLNVHSLIEPVENKGNSSHQTDSNGVATINYTYRGIGRPLGAMLTHKNYLEGTLAYIENTRMSVQTKILSLLPVSAVYPFVGCVLAPLMSGATIVISRNFFPSSIYKLIDKYKIDHFTAVPALYNLLLQFHKKGAYDYSSLVCCITGGAYMPSDYQEAINRTMGIEVFQGYGLTECLPVTWNRYEYNKAGTLGAPLRRDFQIKIVSDDGEDKGVNEVGEIVVNSPTVMQGYYNEPEESEKVLKDGMLYTGDYGYLDEDGSLYFKGLKKNVAKVGGNMADLREIKDVIMSYPLVSDANVYAVEDRMWGHVIKAEIFCYEGRKLEVNDIKSFCGKRLSQHKIAKKVEVITGVAQ